MKVDRLKLLNDLGKVLPGIANDKMVMDDMDTIVINNNHVYSYNSAISVNVEMSQPLDLKVIVKGIDFYNIISKLPEDDIEIEDSGDKLSISCGKANVNINKRKDNLIFERFNSISCEDPWTDINGQEFNNALRSCTIAKNKTEYSGIYVSGHTMIGTNMFVINKALLSAEYPTFWINDKAVSELAKWIDFTAVSMSKMWLHFKSKDNTVFSVRTQNLAKYPADKIIAIIDSAIANNDGIQGELTEHFYNAVTRAATFSEKDDDFNVIHWNINAEGSTISSKRVSGDYNELVEDVKADTDLDIKLDTDVISSCANKLTTFKLINGDDSSSMVMWNDSVYKMFSTTI